jgi:predicted nucleotidyltransferase
MNQHDNRTGKKSRIQTDPGNRLNERTDTQWDFLSDFDKLFRKSAIRVIIALGQQYATKFHVRDLSRSLHYDVSIISKNLKYLEEKGMVTHEDVGNLVFYQANMNNALLRQMKICFTLLEVHELVQNIEPVASQIILYGSCAFGEDTIASDIDLFVETTDKKAVKNIISTFRKGIVRTISPIITTPDETYSLKVNDKSLYSSIHQGMTLKGNANVP